MSSAVSLRKYQNAVYSTASGLTKRTLNENKLFICVFVWKKIKSEMYSLTKDMGDDGPTDPGRKPVSREILGNSVLQISLH